MRLRYFLLCILFCMTAASAQDIITKTDGSQIDGKVEEITETKIRYRKALNPLGPLYTLSVSSVANILFENGTTEEFTTPHQSINANQTSAELFAKSHMYKSIGWIGFGTMTALGITIGSTLWCASGMGAFFVITACPLILCGSVWCLGWNLGANSLARRAMRAATYSAPLISNEVARFGDKTLMAGVNLMGNQMTRTQGLGLSFSLTF